ncbi:hypothetical protein [Comamonas sediminis]|uniref:Lipoprotein n=1 Tax=Comamonas sediminis TaxID=1783360 RepID=A0ABV4B445_9BURK
MKFLPSFAALLGASLLAGCGNIQTVKSFSTAYQEPSDGERARVRIISDGMVRAVPKSACVDWRVPNAGVMVSSKKGFADQNNRTLNMPGEPVRLKSEGRTVVSEFYVPANEPLTFAYLSNGHTNNGKQVQCRVNKTFTPQAGKDYEARFVVLKSQDDKAFSWFNTSANNSCLSLITTLTADGMPDVTPANLVKPSDAALCHATDIL